MPIDLPDDYWIHVPAGTYTLGFTPEDARLYGELAAAYQNSLPLPPMDAWDEIERREKESGNPDHIAAYVLGVAPARTVEIPAFSIAKYPVTSELFFRFLEETGRSSNEQLMAWGRSHREWPVRHAQWQDVESFMVWSGYRIPFEDEWERAARGASRSIYPWGNTFGEQGTQLVELSTHDRLSPADAPRFSSPEGFLAFADRGWEWCADIYFDASGWQQPDPWDRERSRWARRLRRALLGDEAPNVARYGFGFVESGSGFRLVKHNGREVPAAPPMTGWSAAGPRALDFEKAIVRPALVAAQPDLELHRSYVWSSGALPREVGAVPADLDRSFMASFGRHVADVEGAYNASPDRPVRGVYLGAVTMESFRRAANSSHGVFLWTIVYWLDKDENVLAHPVVFYRMHYDGQWHRFDERFRPGEDLTPISEITASMVTGHVLKAFRFYEEYADADSAPPPSNQRETRTPLLPVFRIR